MVVNIFSMIHLLYCKYNYQLTFKRRWTAMPPLTLRTSPFASSSLYIILYFIVAMQKHTITKYVHNSPSLQRIIRRLGNSSEALPLLNKFHYTKMYK